MHHLFHNGISHKLRENHCRAAFDTSGDATLFDATFSNWAQFTQSYPAPDSPAQSGAVAVNTLGYIYLEWQKDATYRIHLSFEHSDPTLVLDFVAEGLQVIGDENWGIDNVAVIVQ